MKQGILVFFCFLFWSLCYGQDQIKIDSLNSKLNNSSVDTTKIKLLLELSGCYSQTDLLRAITHAEKALTIATKIDNKLLIVRSHLAIGSSLLFLGKYDQAMNNILLSLKLAQDNKFETYELISYTHLGIIQDRIQQFDNALNYYFKALSIYNKYNEQGKKLKDIKNIQALYNNIGNIYESNKDIITAEKYYQKGLALAEKANDLINIGVICNNLGKLELQRKNFEKARKYLDKSLDARQKNNDKSGVARSYLFLGNYFQETEKLDSAENYATRAFNIGLEMKEQVTILNASRLLYEINKKLGKSEEALRYHEQFQLTSDSLLNNSNIKEMTRLQMQYDYDKLEKEKELKQQKEKYTFILILASLLAVIIILGSLYFLSRNRNRRIKFEKEKLEEDMIFKNKELTTNVLYLLRKNELIDNITSRLLKLKDKLKEENKEPIQKIIFDLQSITDQDVWNEFELRFQNVHQKFYQNLQDKFPDLSPAEIKLAAFLRLNMTTKEISSITGQNINSLETARYRLRKKLGITNQEINLVNFLLNI